jgi:hypothetical protein
MSVFKRKRPEPGPFIHTNDCAILRADPDAQIPWNEVDTGVWEARCQCGRQYFHEPARDEQARQDPLDPALARHAPPCERASVSEPDMLRLALKVTEKDGYWYVQCASCTAGWQVPFFAEEGVEARRDRGVTSAP